MMNFNTPKIISYQKAVEKQQNQIKNISSHQQSLKNDKIKLAKAVV